MWKIQKYRIAQGLTQENLAERVDLSVSYISEIENGKKRPSLKTLEKIAAALEVSLVSLIGEDNKKDIREERQIECPFLKYTDDSGDIAAANGITREIFTAVAELAMEEKIKVLSYVRDLKKLSEFMRDKR
ncbi:helix-turn-helix transcriptional regulator [Cloacibacillus sp.]|uniref:helix-turn-helix domain-containing protein n=1 Tax=Cloacibacillus sp. TaxID=2049023 RepID=UPI0025B7ED85|nr:helix-turn-helix transcriptional regulator [Cloacibacillus sp.]MCC8056958.1 helix-turn-helix transcriptional regulator [Cloacibacillus sp.]